MAILLDDTVRAALEADIASLARVAPDVAWVAPGNLHLTLKFLGGVDEARLPAIESALDQVLAPLAPFAIAVRTLGAFPTVTRPRVVWAGLGEGADAAAGAADAVERALGPFGFPREERPFSPHVTLGRVRNPRRDPRLEAALRAGAARDFGRVAVAHVALMRSDLSPRGARYTELHASPLRAATV